MSKCWTQEVVSDGQVLYPCVCVCVHLCVCVCMRVSVCVYLHSHLICTLKAYIPKRDELQKDDFMWRRHLVGTGVTESEGGSHFFPYA